MKFQPGDVVRLKAPFMRVQSTSDTEVVHCVWFEGYDVRRGSFHVSLFEDGAEHQDGDIYFEFIEDGSEPTSEPDFIDDNQIEPAPVTNRVDQLANSKSLAKTAKDTIEAFRKPAA